MIKKYSGTIVAIAMCCSANLDAQTDSSGSDPKAMNSAPAMQVHADIRQPESSTGANIGVYGGVIAFQDGDLHSTGGATGDTQSRAGAVAGLRADYTWPSFGAIGNASTSTPSEELLMPAVGADVFWTGYRYKCNLPASSNAQFDVNSLSVMLEPKLKFNLGAWRPYLGVGVGGTYISTGSANSGSPAGGKNFDLRSSDIDFSADALAGVEFFVDPRWSLSVDYKYLFILDPTFNGKSTSGAPTKVEIYGLHNSLFTAGINFYF